MKKQSKNKLEKYEEIKPNIEERLKNVKFF